MEVLVNGQPRPIAEGTTIERLLGELGLAGKHAAVEVNRQLVPRARHAEFRLGDGDRLEIVTLVGGG